MLDSINPLFHPGLEHLNQTSPQGRLCSMLGRLSPRPCAVCALNWRHHPEKDKEERKRTGKREGEAGRKAGMGGFLLYPLWEYSGFSLGYESTVRRDTQALKVKIHRGSIFTFHFQF